MRVFVPLMLLLAACGGGPGDALPRTATPAPATGSSLYHRLGGYDAIAAVVDDFLGRWLGDPQLAGFFEHLDDFGKQHVRQMVVDQFCAATGGPCYYVGLDMATAHEALALTPADWRRAMQHVVATLDAFGVPSRERRELDAILRAVRTDVIGSDAP